MVNLWFTNFRLHNNYSSNQKSHSEESESQLSGPTFIFNCNFLLARELGVFDEA